MRVCTSCAVRSDGEAVVCVHAGGDHRDDRAVWHYAGRADRRNQRPSAVDLADSSELGCLYLAGFGF